MGGLRLPKIRIPTFKLPGKGASSLALGLDIGSHSVKMCQLAAGPKGYRLLSLGSSQLPVGAVEEGTLQDPEAVAEVIVRLRKNLNIKQKKVAISVSGYSVIVKKINLSVMNDAELEEYIQTEAGQYIPFDVEDVYLDYHNLRTNTEHNERTDVMLVAAKKEVVDAYLSMLQSAGMKAVVVDVDGFVLENIYSVNSTLTEDVALVDIGATKMSINIISKQTSVLARDVVVGSRQLTEQIQNRFDLEFDEAEALKIGLTPAEEKQKVMEGIFANTCTQWALEVQKAIDLYGSNNPASVLSKVIISGGGSKVKGFDVFLHEETGIPVEHLNPFNKIEIDKNKIDPKYSKHVGPEMTIAAGLAIRPAIL